MPGIAHASFQQKNYMIAYHILLSFFTQPEPIYSTYKPGAGRERTEHRTRHARACPGHHALRRRRDAGSSPA